MANKHKHTVEHMCKAISEARGNVAIAAKKLDLTRSGLAYNIRQIPELKQAQIDAREIMCDVAEDNLYNEVMDGNMTAIIFTLKTHRRERYSEKFIMEKAPEKEANRTTPFEDLPLEEQKQLMAELLPSGIIRDAGEDE